MVSERFIEDILTEAFLRQRYIDERRSAYSIAKETGTSDGTVRNYLRAYCIPLRSHAEALQTPVDYASFVDLVDDWHAYWIGFLAADGNVFYGKDNYGRITLTVKPSDIDHLQNFQQGLHTTARVRLAPNNRGYNPEGKVAVLSFTSSPFAEALAEWGIGPRKSLTIAWPANFPLDLAPSYIRGYFDGNGTIYVRRRSRPGTQWIETVCRFSSGSAAFLEGLQRELTVLGTSTGQISRNQQSNSFNLPVNSKRENLKAFAALLYQGSTVHLARKKAIFEEAGII